MQYAPLLFLGSTADDQWRYSVPYMDSAQRKEAYNESSVVMRWKNLTTYQIEIAKRVEPNWMQVKDVHKVPYRSVVRIEAHFEKVPETGRKMKQGTGLLLSPYHVLTTAHTLVASQETQTDSIHVFQYANGPDDPGEPVKAQAAFYSSVYASGADMSSLQTANADFALIILEKPLNFHHDFHLGVFSSITHLEGEEVELAGYRARDADSQSFQRMMTDKEPFSLNSNADLEALILEMDADRGQSGGPVFFKHPSHGYIVFGLNSQDDESDSKKQLICTFNDVTMSKIIKQVNQSFHYQQ